jgi:hypothetical protein
MFSRTIFCTLLALSLSACPNNGDDTSEPETTSTTAAPVTVTEDPSTSSGDSSGTTEDPTSSTGDTSTGGDTSTTAGTTDDTAVCGDPAPTCTPDDKRDWCKDVVALCVKTGLDLSGAGGTNYCATVADTCETTPACGTCFYIANTCTQLPSGVGCETVKAECLCRAVQHDLSVEF